MPWPQPLHSVWSLRSIKGTLRRAALQPALDPATRRGAKEDNSTNENCFEKDLTSERS